MKPKTYIETSIPSFYYETRQEPDMIARRQWTRQWWEECSLHYDIFTSDAVLDELRRGHYPIQAETLALASQIPLLPLEEPIFEIVEVYLQHKLMPQNPLGDALHLAIASYHKCDFLLTWNCQNLANANKFAHIKRINNLLGLYLPTLITPLELLGEIS